MPIESINDLYAEELAQLYDAEHRLLDLLPELGDASSSGQLEHACEQEYQHANERKQQLERIFEGLGADPARHRSKSVEGLVRDARDFIDSDLEPAVRDAALTGYIQRIAHHQVAGYGTARAYAKQIGDETGEELLEKCVESNKHIDKELTRIAEENINPKAKTRPPEETRLSEQSGDYSESALGKGTAHGVSRQGALSEPTDTEPMRGSSDREGTPSRRGAGTFSDGEDARGTGDERPRR